MRKCHREFRQKIKSVPAELWGTFVGYCVPQLIAVCVLLHWNKNISTFWVNGAFYYKIKSCAIVGTLYRSRQTTDDNIIRLMRIACCMHSLSCWNCIWKDARLRAVMPTQNLCEMWKECFMKFKDERTAVPLWCVISSYIVRRILWLNGTLFALKMCCIAGEYVRPSIAVLCYIFGVFCWMSSGFTVIGKCITVNNFV
jgi:hypothetical protein